MRNQTLTSRRAFTVIEAMVVMGIIALLAAILFVAIRHVRSSGDVAAEQAMVRALQHGAEEFKNEFNFSVPLVIDQPSPQVLASGAVRVWPSFELCGYSRSGTAVALNGSSGPGNLNCYSVLSLAYFLAGALPEQYDGVKGLGFTAPDPARRAASGGYDELLFSKRGRKHEPLVDPSQQKTRTGQIRLRIANAGSTDPQMKLDCQILDRWSDGTGFAVNDRAIRYYRWQPAFYTKTDEFDPPPAGKSPGDIHYFNIPVAVGGDPDPSKPPANPLLKSAEWAIVSAGPDRLFGDEGGAANPAAAADNIVEVGK